MNPAAQLALLERYASKGTWIARQLAPQILRLRAEIARERMTIVPPRRRRLEVRT